MFCNVKTNSVEVKTVERVVEKIKEVPERTYSGSKSISNMGGYTPLAVKVTVKINRSSSGRSSTTVYAVTSGGSHYDIATLTYDGFSSGSATMTTTIDLLAEIGTEYTLRSIRRFEGVESATVVRWK